MKAQLVILVIAGILIQGTFTPPLLQAEEYEFPEITIEFVNGKVIDLDDGTQLVRANISIKNYNTQDGYHFMKVTRLSDEVIIKESEIIPKYIDDEHWGTQIAHYLDPSGIDEYVIGDYELQVYSQYGFDFATERFSIIKSSVPQLNTQFANEVLGLEIEQETSEEIDGPENIESESRLPTWVHNIFVWYAELTISEDELLQALEYLINQGIIQVNVPSI